MNDRAARPAADRPRLRIEKDSDAVFDAAIRAGVLSEDPQDERFAGRYMYMHHDADGTAWFKHREARAYLTVRPEETEARRMRNPLAVGPSIGLWATIMLTGVFLAGALLGLEEGPPGIGTVRLDDLTAEFLAGAVRDDGSARQTAEAARTWGAQLEAALDAVAEAHGVVLLPAGAVAAGAADYTAEVRAAMRLPGRAAAVRPGAGGSVAGEPESGR